MTIREMTWLYIQKRIYAWFYTLPAIRVPFPVADPSVPFDRRIAVIVHCYYLDLMEEMLTHIQHIPFPYRLYVSTDTEEKRTEILRLINAHQIQGAEVRLAPNRGRDIAPKYITFRDVYEHCDYFLHLHSKKTPQAGSWGEAWRRHLLHTLAGSPEIIHSNLRLLEDQRLGLIFAIPLDDPTPDLRWGGNFDASFKLARGMGVEIRPEFCFDYPTGGMYWGKAEAIKPLLNLGLHFEDFPEEKAQLDSALHHAFERMIIYSALKQGLYGCRVSANVFYPRLQPIRGESTMTAVISACLAAQKREEQLLPPTLHRRSKSDCIQSTANDGQTHNANLK